MFKGIFTALLTPFKYGEVDFDAFEKMVDWQIESGVKGLVVAGSTGEGQNLTEVELLKLVETAVKKANGRVKIIANTGSHSTADSVELTEAAQKLKVDGIMIVAPYYIKPTQEGIYQHFKTIHDSSKLPILIYNNPGRTGVDITNETLFRLAELPRIVALKDCSGNPIRCSQLKQKIRSNFEIIAGDDILTLPFYSQGAVGLISVTSNIVPSLVVQLDKLWNENKIKEAINLQSIMQPLNEALFCEPNPVAVKYAASQFELCLPDLRLPLVPLSERNKKLVRETLQDLKAKLYDRSK
jgi:4-hydroxy-tetrahydrodipicolinate synthase